MIGQRSASKLWQHLRAVCASVWAARGGIKTEAQVPKEDESLMARLGDNVLYTPGSAQSCGAAFTLTVAASANAALAFPGFEVEVAKGQRDVVVRFDGASTAADAFRRGHQLAQQGLDMLSLLGKCDVTIQDAESEHSVWWLEGKVL